MGGAAPTTGRRSATRLGSAGRRAADDHHGNVGIGSTPLLVFDAWEHAYYLQYKNVRPDYVQKLWDLVNWNDVAARLTAAKNA